MSREEFFPSFSTNKDRAKSWPTSFHYDTDVYAPLFTNFLEFKKLAFPISNSGETPVEARGEVQTRMLGGKVR